MINKFDSVHHFAEHLTSGQEKPMLISMQFGLCVVEVRTNSQLLLRRLTHYFSNYLPINKSHPDIVINALEASVDDFGLSYVIKQPDPGKTKIKEEFCDFHDGRVVRKRLTGMLFLFGNNLNLAYGPCVENDNQVINFINNRFIEWVLHRGALLCHAAGVSDCDRGLAFAGYSGTGKSTLALKLVSAGFDFVSNDRLMIQRYEHRLKMTGVAKMPRINPGTVLNNPDLASVMTSEERSRVSGLSSEELWGLEQKYDADIDMCFGPGRLSLSASMVCLVVLTWMHDAGPLIVRPVDLASRGDLLNAFKKDVGLFYRDKDGDSAEKFQANAYLETMGACPVFEFAGGAHFDEAASLCLRILCDGEMPTGCACGKSV